MPSLRRLCNTPSCGHVAVRGSSYCAPCKAKTEARRKRRPSAAKRGYDHNWRRTRAAYIKRHPTCEEPGCNDPTEEVDHVVPIAKGGARLSWDNLSAKCRTHHSRKSINENRGPGGRIQSRWT